MTEQEVVAALKAGKRLQDYRGTEYWLGSSGYLWSENDDAMEVCRDSKSRALSPETFADKHDALKLKLV